MLSGRSSCVDVDSAARRAFSRVDTCNFAPMMATRGAMLRLSIVINRGNKMPLLRTNAKLVKTSGQRAGV